MKKIVTLLCLFVFTNIEAQSFDIELRAKAGSPQILEVVLKPNGIVVGDVVDQIVFTIQRQASCGATLGVPTTYAPLGTGLAKSGSETSASGVVSQSYAANPAVSLSSVLSSYVIAEIPTGITVSGCPFSIPSVFNGSLGSYYIDGLSNAGTILNMSMAGSTSGIVLPVELLSFKGIKKGKTSQLQWETTSEKNLVNYIIERSSDGRNFHPVGFTKPKSNSATEKVAYDFIDDQPEIGLNYYRLLSKGIGKDEKYSKVISLDFGLGLSGRAYPNPLDGDLIIDLDIESNSGEVEVGIYDVVGKQVLSRKIQNNDRRINSTLPTSDLPPGMYIVKVKVGSFNWERQITKM